jgi:hypothetical protein
MNKEPISAGAVTTRLIETEEAAKRLARVILSDIELYNQPKIQARADLRRELAEGLALFRSRVVPTLVPLFSQVASTRPWVHDVPMVVMSPPRDQIRVDTAAFQPTDAALLGDPPEGTRSSEIPPPRALHWRQISKLQIAGLVASIAVAAAVIAYCSLTAF